MSGCDMCPSPDVDIVCTMQIEATSSAGRAALKKASGEEHTEQVVKLCAGCAQLLLTHFSKQGAA